MKKLLIYFAIILTLFISLPSQADNLGSYAITLTGRWQPAEDPLLIDRDGFVDIQNMRRDGQRLKGINGSTKINTSVWDSTNDTPLNGFHYRKDALKSNYRGQFGQSSGSGESHVLIHAKKDDSTATAIYENETAIPSAGAFNASALYTFNEYSTPARFSNTPRGELTIANGDEILNWGGDETFIVSFITSTAAATLTDPKDFTEAVTNKNRSFEYTAQVGKENDSYTKLLLHMDGADASTTFTDSSATPHTVTANGDAQLDTADNYFGVSSGLFDGTGDELEIPDHADWTLGTGNFTIDFWIRCASSLPSTDQISFVYHYEDALTYWYFYAHRQISGIVTFGVYGDAGSLNQTFSLSDSTGRIVDDGDWHHIALVRGYGSVGASITDNMAVFVDGYVVSSVEETYDFDDYVGVIKFFDDGSQDYNGWVDELRWSKGICRFTANFVPPERPYGDDAKHWYVGSSKPLTGLKYYLNQVNALSATISTYKEWQGNKWVTLSNFTDNTTGLSVAGTTTWDESTKAQVKVIQGLSLYWYRFTLSDGGATIYYVSALTPVQKITNIWDGSYLPVAKFKVYNGTKYQDNTREVQDSKSEWLDQTENLRESRSSFIYSNPYLPQAPKTKKTVKEYTLEVQSEETNYYADIGGLTSADGKLELGFTEPVQGFLIKFVSGNENSTANTDIDVEYWDGNSWTDVSGLTDNTDSGSISFNQTGTVTFTPPEYGYEFPRTRKDDLPLYYYRIHFDENLSASTYVFQILGIPNPKPIRGYSFPAKYQNRLFLFDERESRRNVAIYSAYNAGYIFNGDDSGELTFGGEDAVLAAANIFNVYRTTGFDQLIVAKKHETYRLFGVGPEDWDIQPLSKTIGVVAPLSMAVANFEDKETGTIRQVAVWQAAGGVVVCDGASVRYISDDIKHYWNPTDSAYIDADRQDDSFGWYDVNLQSYKLLISSGSGQSSHNIELEYSFKYNQWTKIYRQNGGGSPAAEPLLIGIPVMDTDGHHYSYGAIDGGTMYRLENGKQFDGDTPIPQYVQTKQLMLDSQLPFMKFTTIQWIRTAFKPKTSAGDADPITITHYCDGGAATVDGTSGQETPATITPETNYFDTQDVVLGPCLYHSLKFSATVDQYDDGIELLGIGLYFDTEETIRGTF